MPHSRLLLRGLAVRLTDGMAGAPTLREALRRCRAEPQGLDWLSVSYNMVAVDLWDDEAWFELASGQVRLAPRERHPQLAPFALDYLAGSPSRVPGINPCRELSWRASHTIPVRVGLLLR